MSFLFRQATTVARPAHPTGPGLLHVRVVEGRDFAAADPNGYSDPYVKTLHPVWNFDCTFNVTNWNDEITFEIYDEDEYSSNDFLGFLKFKLSEIASKETRVWGGWKRCWDKKHTAFAQGRVFVVCVVDLGEGTERSAIERQSILYHATQAIEKESSGVSGNTPATMTRTIAPPSLPATAVAAGSSSSSSSTSAITAGVSDLTITTTPPGSSSSYTSPSTTTTATTSLLPSPPVLPVVGSLSVFVATWNVGNAISQEDLSSWLILGHDLYAIGVQECKYDVPGGALKQLSVISACGSHFQDILTKNLGEEYVLVKRCEMMELRHYVYVRKALHEHIDTITSGHEATGLGGVVGNKGGVAVGLHYDDISLCFITCHLAAHQHQSEKRNDDVMNILSGLKLNNRGIDVSHSYQHIFWSGDLNYRCNYGTQGMNHSPTQEEFDRIVAIIDKNDPAQMKELYESDQLLYAMNHRQVFLDWESESTYHFKPTFKVARNELLEYKSQRSPAWCDRVLTKCFLNKDMHPQFASQQVKYQSSNDVLTSDHKPVYAMYTVPLLRTPLSTDFSLGSLTIRFHRLTLQDLSTARTTLTNPFIKFSSTFLKHSVETKYKTNVHLPGTPGSRNGTLQVTPPAGGSVVAASPSVNSPASASATSASSSTLSPVDPTATPQACAASPVTPSSAAAGATLTPNAVGSRSRSNSNNGSSSSASSSFLQSLGDKVTSVGSSIASVSSAMASSAKNTFTPKQSLKDGCANISTESFTWSQEEIPVLHSQVNNPACFYTQYLNFKVLSYSYESKIEKQFAFGKVDLSTGQDGVQVPFEIVLEYGGLPVGKLTGAFTMEWNEKEKFVPLDIEKMIKLTSPAGSQANSP